MASPGLIARRLGDLDGGPLRAVVAAWGVLGPVGDRTERVLEGLSVSAPKMRLRLPLGVDSGAALSGDEVRRSFPPRGFLRRAVLVPR
jgi:hypothetical protein